MSSNFLGLNYPITKNSAGYFGQISDTNTIKADLLILLLTNFGERVMLPNYGTNLRSLLFEPNDTVLEQKATNLITTAISTWEPRVRVEQLTVISSVTAVELNQNTNLNNTDHVLTITIVFSQFSDLKTVDELVLQVPIG